jgi:hypothetical protein
VPKASIRLRRAFNPAGRGLEASISRTVSISALFFTRFPQSGLVAIA